MGKTPAQATLDAVVAAALARTLRDLGYRKQGRTFRRTHGGCIQVVNVQASTASASDELAFTVNVGVYFPEVAAADDSWQPPMGKAGPDVWSCHLRERIGFLMPERQDKWWELKAGTQPRNLVAELDDSFRTRALPWLERMSDLRNAAARAEHEHPGSHVAAAFRAVLGATGP